MCFQCGRIIYLQANCIQPQMEDDEVDLPYGWLMATTRQSGLLWSSDNELSLLTNQTGSSNHQETHSLLEMQSPTKSTTMQVYGQDCIIDGGEDDVDSDAMYF